MVLSIPQHPFFSEEIFTASISANTNGQPLSVWILSISYDPQVVSYVKTSTSSLFRTAIVNNNIATGTLKMTTSGLNSGITSADVTGVSVPVVSISFKVSSSATYGIHSNVLSLIVIDMVNEYTLKFASSVTGNVIDERDGTHTKAQLTISPVSIIGLLAFMPRNEIVNSAPLTGIDVSSPIVTFAIYNRVGAANTVLTSGVTCSRLSSVNAFSLFGCKVVARASHLSG
jgi:hypothetical protein